MAYLFEEVVITGGSGFLGQHLVRYIQNSCPEVTSIKVIDRLPFQKFIEYVDRVPVESYIGDCTDLSIVRRAARGCAVLYHLAARNFSIDLFTDDKQYYKDNVKATEVVLEACRLENVANLIHVGSAVATIEPFDSFGHSEVITTTKPENTQFGIYAVTKFESEQIINRKKSALMQNGQPIQTMIIRLGFLYGEGDSVWVPNSIKICERFGFLPQIGCGRAGLFQYTYAGNAAAVLIKASTQLMNKPEAFNGETIFCSENTMGISYYEFIKPYVEGAGFIVGKPISYYPAVVGSWLVNNITKLTRTLSMGIFSIGHTIPNYQVLRIIAGRYFNFSNVKCRLFLDFVPVYDSEIGMKDSIEWWKKKCDAKVPHFNQKNIHIVPNNRNLQPSQV